MAHVYTAIDFKDGVQKDAAFLRSFQMHFMPRHEMHGTSADCLKIDGKKYDVLHSYVDTEQDCLYITVGGAQNTIILPEP